MPDNCYWIEEVGAFEVCAVEELPGLPIGWIDYDSEPDTLGGARLNWGGPGMQHVMPAYGNGIICIAAKFDGGDPTFNTQYYSSGVLTSDDDGFTYSGFIDKFPWQAGTIGYGYLAWPYYDGSRACNGFGTAISHDGANFYVVENSLNDIAGDQTWVFTSKSADGVNWTLEKSQGNGDYCTHSDSYNGNLWYLGTNVGLSDFGPGDPAAFVVGHSTDDGATWTIQNITTDLNWYTTPFDIYWGACANQDGFHLMLEEYIDNSPSPDDYGVYYHRPTSATTWAAGIQLWEYNINPLNLSDLAGGAVLASRVNPLNIYAIHSDFQHLIYSRRSSDGGVTWSGAIVAADIGAHYWAQDVAANHHRIVELDDGRVGIVFAYENDATGLFDLGYTMSNDGGATWEPWIVAAAGTFIYSDYYDGGRIQACSRGPDILVAATDHDLASRTFIIRPDP